MSRSILDKQHTGIYSRTLLATMVSLVMTVVLSGCGGGLIGTEDTTEVDATSSSDLMPPDTEDTEGSTPDAVPGAETPASPDNTPDGEDQSNTFGFSNTTPSGLDATSTTVPALKLINLAGLSATVTIPDNQTMGESISIPAQATSELISIQTGESTVTISIEGDSTAIATIDPLNAAADSMTTLVIAPTEDTTDNAQASDGQGLSVLALDTRAAVSANGMAEVRIISTVPANPDTTQPLYSFSPNGDESSGVEFELNPANNDGTSVNLYSLVTAGSYILSSNEAGFTPLPIALAKDTVYTIVITNNPQAPVYVEVDSVAGN